MREEKRLTKSKRDLQRIRGRWIFVYLAFRGDISLSFFTTLGRASRM